MVGAEDGELLVEADAGPSVALPGEYQEDRGDEESGQFQPVLEDLYEGDGPHAARGYGDDDDGRDEHVAEPAGRPGEDLEGQPGALELRYEVEPARRDHEDADQSARLP